MLGDGVASSVSGALAKNAKFGPTLEVSGDASAAECSIYERNI